MSNHTAILIDETIKMDGKALIPAIDRDGIKDYLSSFVDSMVTVFCGVASRNSFDPQINVQGNLEQHPGEPYSFRVVLNPEDDHCGTYAYFNCDCVTTISRKKNGFGDGSSLVVEIDLSKE